MRKLFAVTMGSVVALVGFAGAANASATVDLIWIDTTDTACIDDDRRDCPQLGTTLSSVLVSDNITLGVILTAGPGGIAFAGVGVDYGDALPTLDVTDFQRLSTTPYLPRGGFEPNNDTEGWVVDINALGGDWISVGIGLPAGQTAYLGTVTFHKDAHSIGTFEIEVGIGDGAGGEDPDFDAALLDLDTNLIGHTTTFNSAFLVNAAPTPTPTPDADCLCEVQNINPNQVVLQNVGTGGKGSSATRKMVVTVNAVDAPGATCDPGEFSNPTSVNLKMEDDRCDGAYCGSTGDILIDSAKTVVCEQGVTMNLKRNVLFQSPLNCENGALPPPKPDFSLGTITSTGSAPGTADYVEGIKIKCFE
jgi:hypothetical protein